MNTQNFFIVLVIIAFAGFSIYTLAKSRGALSTGPRSLRLYGAPGKTAAECRRLLGQRTEEDLFSYRLEASADGNWRVTFTGFNSEAKFLDANYLLQFENQNPASFSLQFEKKANGPRESTIPDELLDRFFEMKLGARPALPESTPETGA